MAIHKAALVKKFNDVVQHIHPKTIVDIVQYDNDYSVYEKRELIDIRVGYVWDDNSNVDETTYASTGKSIRLQLNAISNEIVNYLYKNWTYNKLNFLEYYQRVGGAAFWLCNLNLMYNSTGGVHYGNS